MICLDILFAGLESHILYRRGCTEKRRRGGLLLLDPELRPQPEALYLTDWQDLPEDLPADCCVFLADGGSCPAPEQLCPSCGDLVLFDLRLPRLHNALTVRYNRYDQWRHMLEGTDDMQVLTDLLSSASGCCVSIVDSFFNPMALSAQQTPKSSVFRTLMLENALPQDLAETMLPAERSRQYPDKLLFPFPDCNVIDYLIRYDNRSIARVLVEYTSDAVSDTVQHYIDDFLRVTRPLIQSSDTLKKLSMNAISTLIGDLIELRVTDSDEVERRRRLVPDLVKGKAYHPVVIRFCSPGADIPYNYISGQLERIFYHASVTSYNKGLLVIAAKNSHDAPLEYERDQLMVLLERYDAYAGIGDCTMFLSCLRPMYIQASATARLGRVFCREPGQRIFSFADYRMHFYADLVIEAAVRQHNFWNISYLCNPGIIAILRYDKKYDKDLYPTLEAYLQCSCNATLCAQKLNVHRNTINYRVNLIEELLGNSLSDFAFRQSVEFSMIIMEYEVKYLHCNPLDTSGKLAMDLDWGAFRSFTERP